MSDLARLILLLLLAAILWNAANGTLGAWFRSKFLGRPPARPEQPAPTPSSTRPRTTITPTRGVRV